MKNIIKNIFSPLSPLSPLSEVYTKSIARLQKRIGVFSNAKSIIEDYLKTNRKVLSKSKMIALFDSIDNIETKIGFYCDILSKVSQKSIIVANENTVLTPIAKMYDVQYYREIGNEYGIDTNTIETLKKFYTSCFMAQARLQASGTSFDKLPKKALYAIAFGAIHHSHHQQACNNGAWLSQYSKGECKEILDLLGYKSSYTEE